LLLATAVYDLKDYNRKCLWAPFGIS